MFSIRQSQFIFKNYATCVVVPITSGILVPSSRKAKTHPEASGSSFVVHAFSIHISQFQQDFRDKFEESSQDFNYQLKFADVPCWTFQIPQVYKIGNENFADVARTFNHIEGRFLHPVFALQEVRSSLRTSVHMYINQPFAIHSLSIHPSISNIK